MTLGAGTRSPLLLPTNTSTSQLIHPPLRHLPPGRRQHPPPEQHLAASSLRPRNLRHHLAALHHLSLFLILDNSGPVHDKPLLEIIIASLKWNSPTGSCNYNNLKKRFHFTKRVQKESTSTQCTRCDEQEMNKEQASKKTEARKTKTKYCSGGHNSAFYCAKNRRKPRIRFINPRFI